MAILKRSEGERRRLILLVGIMTALSLTVVGTTVAILYGTSFDESRQRLEEAAKNQARLIEAIARFNAVHGKEDFPGGPKAATLSQILDASDPYEGLNPGIEFVLARREADQIVFLVRRRHGVMEKPDSVPFDSHLAEPMRRALKGLSGTVVGLDYRGVPVLAAHEPVAEMDLGLVVKMDLASIRSPFVRAAGVALFAGFLVTLLGVGLFVRIVNPLIRRLEASEAGFRESAEFNKSIIESSRDCIKILDLDGRLKFMSEGGKELLGVEDLGPYLDMPYEDFWKGSDHTAVLEAISIARKGGVGNFQGYCPTVRGDPKWWDVVVSPIFDAEGHVGRLLVVSRDIGEQRAVLEALQQARNQLAQRVEERTAELRQANQSLMREIEEHKLTGKTLLKARDSLTEAQRVAHLGNWDWDNVSNDLQWSDEVFRIFGLRPQEFGATYEAFLRSVHPEDRELVNEAVNRALKLKEPYSIDHRIVLPDGTERIVHEQAAVTFDETGRPVRMLGTVQDITDRKRMEEALQRSERELRLLSSRLLRSAQESERKRIARELHDGIGQTLSAIKFSLENTLANLKDEITAAGREGLERLIPMMQKAIEEVRKTSQGLRPSILDDLGLLATIAWFCREFHAIYSAIEVRQQIELEEAHVPGDLKIVLFRILQESVNNAAKHSGADLVRIGLKEASSGGIELSVEDNGCGFEPGSVFLSDGTDRGLGLASMRERAELSGGSLRIESIPGEGTLVRACWPADPG